MDIEYDNENPEWTNEDSRLSLRVFDIFTPEQLASLQKSQAKMRDHDLASQKRVSLTLDSDIIARFKATGKGWQSRINQALRDASPHLTP